MPLDDAALLRLWTVRRNAEAFNEIVERFADQVYGTCRRILRNDADAEEVAQECFFALARSADEVRTSLGGWLHYVATYKSRERIRADARRRSRERAYGATTQQSVTPNCDDILEHVDAAIEVLPETTREVIVAHFLGRKTHSEIAAELRVSRRAVSYRIERGLESIRQDLGRRGVTLSVVALGASLSAKAGAAPASLKATLGKLAIAAGTTSGAGGATVTSSVLGSLIIMNTKSIIACIALGLVLAGAGFFAFRGAKPAPAPTPRVTPVAKAKVVKPAATTTHENNAVTAAVSAPPKTTVSQTQSKKPTMTALLALSRSILEGARKKYAPIPEPASISGAVLDHNGYAIAGATVLLTPADRWGSLPGAGKLSREVTSGTDGSYLIAGIKNGGRYWINATKTGYADGARASAEDTQIQIKSGMHATGINFKLDTGVTLRGQVVSASGTPVPDGIVEDISIAGPNSMMLQRYSARTNGNGYFTMGFDVKDRGNAASLRVQSAQCGSKAFPDVVIQDDHVVVLRLSAPAIIHGTIRYNNGQPASDARLKFVGEKSAVFPAEGAGQSVKVHSFAGLFSALCDHDGQYAVEVDAGLDYDVEVAAVGVAKNEKRGQVTALKPGERRVFNLVLDANVITVHGRIIGTPSGKPFNSVVSSVMVFARRRGVQGIQGDVGRANMNAQGGYELTLPGKSGEYTFHAGYMLLREVPGETSAPQQLKGGDDLNLDLTLPEPQYFRVRAVDTAGNPLAGVTVNAVTGPDWSFGRTFIASTGQTNEDGRLDKPLTMPPNTGSQLYLEKPGYATTRGTLFADQSPGTVHPEETIVLRRGAGFEGNVVDVHGTPLAGVALSISVTDRDGKAWALKTSTDTSGHFTVVDQAPAGVVDIAISAGAGGGKWSTKQLQLQADAITELGNITLK